MENELENETLEQIMEENGEFHEVELNGTGELVMEDLEDEPVEVPTKPEVKEIELTQEEIEYREFAYPNASDRDPLIIKEFDSSLKEDEVYYPKFRPEFEGEVLHGEYQLRFVDDSESLVDLLKKILLFCQWGPREIQNGIAISSHRVVTIQQVINSDYHHQTVTSQELLENLKAVSIRRETFPWYLYSYIENPILRILVLLLLLIPFAVNVFLLFFSISLLGYYPLFVFFPVLLVNMILLLILGGFLGFILITADESYEIQTISKVLWFVVYVFTLVFMICSFITCWFVLFNTWTAKIPVTILCFLFMNLAVGFHFLMILRFPAAKHVYHAILQLRFTDHCMQDSSAVSLSNRKEQNRKIWDHLLTGCILGCGFGLVISGFLYLFSRFSVRDYTDFQSSRTLTVFLPVNQAEQAKQDLLALRDDIIIFPTNVNI